MDAEQVLEFLDSRWFYNQIIPKQPQPLPSATQEFEIHKEKPTPAISRLPSRHFRSLSNELGSETSFCSELSSPTSVLHVHKLQTIQSGKKVKEESRKLEKVIVKRPVSSKKVTRRKSLSDLEFEELKGFMDLGFVFSEEDMNSELVSIIPGLHRLANRDEIKDRNREENEALVSRPYLSEAWDVMDQETKENPLVNWRIPSLSNEIDMKEHLRCWAHTVASIAIR